MKTANGSAFLLVCLVILLPLMSSDNDAGESPPPHSILDLVGQRSDKNSVGHGRNVALYTGRPSRFFFATHELGDVFSAVDGSTVQWYPDYVVIEPAPAPAGQPASAVIERRQVCVTQEDVIVSRIHLTNASPRAVRHRIEVQGDCRGSFDWREKPGGEKSSGRLRNRVLLQDKNVFPAFLPDGLALAIGGSVEAKEIVAEPPGTYRMLFEVSVPAKGERSLTLACAVDPNPRQAQTNLLAVLKQHDPVAENRKEWGKFFEDAVPQFRCSDRGLSELYAFRWFLLRFSTAGGDLGYFKYPVVLEGRQAYQTYCCYSAPFLAFDLNWAADPTVGFGHIANMAPAAYPDGRFPWYTSARTNQVKLDHDSRTGLSLLPQAAWKHFLIHGDKGQLRQIYPAVKKNLEWWIRDRDPNADGLFDIAHQYETGMDDLHRWGSESMTWRYEAVDATSYAYANLRAAERSARALEENADADYFARHAEQTAAALNTQLWNPQNESWQDRHPQTKKLADVLAITTFYPFYAGVGGVPHLNVFRKHLFNPDQFWLPFPVPALAGDQPDFNPEGFWQGPSWPAATSHVLEAAASTAKEIDRTLLPQVAELFQRAFRVHLQPRADFYERYNPLTGRPLSRFRDYMHSWWIDLIIQHVAGLTVQEDGSVMIDPLPLGLEYFELLGAPVRGQRVDVLWRDPAASGGPTAGVAERRRSDQASKLQRGLLVRVNGKAILYRVEFKPGEAPVRVELPGR